LENILAGVVMRWSGVAFLRIIDDESLWHGAAVPRRRSRDGGHVQGGGTVWRHGGVNDRPGRGHTDLCLEDIPPDDVVDGFYSVCMRCSLRAYYTG
jgi:hypothetical protein